MLSVSVRAIKSDSVLENVYHQVWEEERKVRMRLVAEVRAWRVTYHAENA